MKAAGAPVPAVLPAAENWSKTVMNTPVKPALRGCFVTGTDTEVGKTRVSAGLLRWLARQGVRAAGYKPVAAGMEQDAAGCWFNEDVRVLQQAGSVALPDEQICTVQLRLACAPHVAAGREGRRIHRAQLNAGAQRLARLVDYVVVEGAGGLCVPLGDDWDSADLMADLGLPVILVVGMRLGCINHAVLTAESVRARGLRLAGWVANSVQPSMAFLDENLQTLHALMLQRFQAPCLGVVPHLAVPTADALVGHLDAMALQQIFIPDREFSDLPSGSPMLRMNP